MLESGDIACPGCFISTNEKMYRISEYHVDSLHKIGSKMYVNSKKKTFEMDIIRCQLVKSQTRDTTFKRRGDLKRLAALQEMSRAVPRVIMQGKRLLLECC